MLALTLALAAIGCTTSGPAPTIDPTIAPSPPAEAASAETPTPTVDVATAPLDAVLPLAPDLVSGTLPNGMQYLIRRNERPAARAELRLAVDAGSAIEDPDQLGMAHFVEHMAFNGTNNFEKQELISYLQEVGMRFGADINAYTGFDETVYQLTVPTSDAPVLERAFVILADWAARVAFDPEEVEKERGVIFEEWRLGQGAGSRLRDRQLPLVFKGSRYAERLPIGTPESIRTTPLEDMRRFYDDWYRPDLMTVIAVGDFDPSQIEAWITQHLGALPAAESPRPRPRIEVPGHEETLVGVFTDPELTGTQVSVLFKHRPLPEGRVGDYRRSLVANLYNLMFNARLGELAQQADPPFVVAFSGNPTITRESQLYQLEAQVRDGGVARGLDALLLEVERVDRHGFVESELARAKKSLLSVYEQLDRERDRQPSAQLAAELLRHTLEDEPVPGIDAEARLARRFVPEITVEEVNALGQRWITEENRVLLVAAPEQSNAPPPTETELLAAFERVDASEIEPWVDLTRDQPLLAEVPTPGEIVSERAIEEIGVVEWSLSNGARVILKPTDFKNDEVLFRAFSPGGHSLVSDADWASATFADSLIGQSGVGNFSLVELGKSLAGEVARVSPFVGELDEGLNGSAAPDDLETLFQLAHLYVTAPRLDQEAIDAYLERVKTAIAHRQSSPEVALADAFMATATGEHPRRRPMTPELLAEIDPQRSFEIYRERFADISDFTFLFVGSFELETLRPLVETYLASLPGLDRGESWGDLRIDEPEGIAEVRVRRGLEPKASVEMLFHDDATWSRGGVFLVQALRQVLEIRFTETVREEMSATYGVRVGARLTKRPEEESNVTVSFSCDPDNVDAVIAEVLKQMEDLRAAGPDAREVEKVREFLSRSREVNLRENGFWAGVLESYYSLELDPRGVLDHDRRVAELSVETLRQAAQDYLPTDRYVLGVLLPAEPAAGVESAGAAANAPSTR
ncbi:MAG: insulinase family protein [Acidobacteriota bacterium]